MNRNLTILLVEDSDSDLYFLKRAFSRTRIVDPLQEARSVADAMARSKRRHVLGFIFISFGAATCERAILA